MSVLKKEFIDRMAETGGITKKAARQGFELFIETLLDCMCENEKVMINVSVCTHKTIEIIV